MRLHQEDRELEVTRSRLTVDRWVVLLDGARQQRVEPVSALPCAQHVLPRLSLRGCVRLIGRADYIRQQKLKLLVKESLQIAFCVHLPSLARALEFAFDQIVHVARAYAGLLTQSDVFTEDGGDDGLEVARKVVTLEGLGHIGAPRGLGREELLERAALLEVLQHVDLHEGVFELRRRYGRRAGHTRCDDHLVHRVDDLVDERLLEACQLFAQLFDEGAEVDVDLPMLAPQDERDDLAMVEVAFVLRADCRERGRLLLQLGLEPF
eukprot:2748734-Prymnesium_polylepis.1